MIADAAISWEAPWGVVGGAILLVLSIVMVWWRGLDLGRGTVALGLGGALLLAIGAGEPGWNRRAEKWVSVMVDVSGSTRGAAYRDRAALEKRVAQLLGKVPYRIGYFADGMVEAPGGGDVLGDVTSDKTRFPVPGGAGAILLFSDCRFELPVQIAPTYVVVDAGLEDVDDARVTSLQIRGNEMSAGISNGGRTRGVSMRGVSGGSTATSPNGSIVLSRNVAAGAPVVSAELTAGDLWPENDRLSAVVPPPETLERWWVGKGAAPAGWRAMGAGELPGDAGAYLSAGVIVLDNVAARELSDVQQQRLGQYVRDAGGGLIILGGDHAFGAGGYAGSLLEGLSPVASRPPEPTAHWVVLVDQSGSMGGEVEGGGTRWEYAGRAVKAVVAAIPPEDLASVGGFAEGVNWWAEGKRVKDLGSTPLPPGNAYPHGPTNLEQALESVERMGGTMPVQVLVISDFDAKIGDARALTAGFKTRAIKVHLLAIGEGSALKAMEGISSATGGMAMTQLEPARWTAAAKELLRAALPDLVRRDPVQVQYFGAMEGNGGGTVSIWNRVWVKQGATKLAEANDGANTVPMVASWNAGEGRVVAAVFGPGPRGVEAMAKLVERKPRDPRFRVTWEAGAKVHVIVDAVEEGKFLNDVKVGVELLDQGSSGASAEVTALTQTGPGKYEAWVDAPRSPRLATVRAEGRVLERFEVAGRYAAEFEAVGNDHAAMEELSRRSGGRVIGVGEDQEIKIEWPGERVPLSAECGILGAGLILGALWRWRRS